MIQSDIRLPYHPQDHFILCHDVRAFRPEFYRAHTNSVAIRGVDPGSGMPDLAARLQRRILMISPSSETEHETGAKDPLFLPLS